MNVLIEEGQEIARKLGGEVIYERPWLPYGPEGEFLGHFFTDVLTGSSFSAKTLEEAKATLIQSRKDWGEKPPVFANNPAVKGGKMPEREISPAVIIIPVGLGLGLLGVLAAVAWAAPPEEEAPPGTGMITLYGTGFDVKGTDWNWCAYWDYADGSSGANPDDYYGWRGPNEACTPAKPIPLDNLSFTIQEGSYEYGYTGKHFGPFVVEDGKSYTINWQTGELDENTTSAQICYIYGH